MLIYENENFSVVTYDKPHHPRENGGHIVIKLKKQFAHLEEMDDAMLTAMIKFAKNVGIAMKKTLTTAGVDIVRINYQVNGNWAYFEPNPKPFVHLHLYGRAFDEKHPDNNPKFQAFPEALCFPSPTTDYYDNFSPLTREDCVAIQKILEGENE